jgi:hypothetical protein
MPYEMSTPEANSYLYDLIEEVRDVDDNGILDDQDVAQAFEALATLAEAAGLIGDKSS